jgi:GT2 family glycosyltransferase
VSSRPLASVIVPSFQSAATIDACLEGVLAQDFGGPYEVFLADSGTDGAAARVQRVFPTVKVLHSTTRLGAAPARNWGAREAAGAVLAFIDSDCVPGRDWLRRLCATLEDGAYDGVGGSIANADRASAASWAGYFCEFREFLPGGPPADATYLTPGNVAYRSDTFRKAGGFPDGYFPLEDQVFYERLRQTGARIRFDPSIVVCHYHRTRVWTFLVHQTRIGTANAKVARTLSLRGATIASRPWLTLALAPALATYRLGRTVAGCWRQERGLILRSPAIMGLCALGMLAWAAGFARGSASEGRHRRAASGS